MTGQHSDDRTPAKDGPKRTVFGEPVWLDTLKTLGVFAVMLALIVVVGGALGIAIMAPWGRASFDCSIYCVLEQYIASFFTG